MNQQERDVGFVDLYIWGHETTPYHQFPIEDHTGEVGILQALRQVHWPEEVRDKAVNSCKVVLLEVTEVNASWLGGWGWICLPFLYNAMVQLDFRWEEVRCTEYEGWELSGGIRACDGGRVITCTT